MAQIYKLFLLLLLTTDACYASFNVEPSELNIHIGEDSILTVENNDYNKHFSLVLKEDRQVSNDLQIDPSSFDLIPNQEQMIRIRTKSGIDYTDKKYALYIVFDSTTQDTHTHIFKIPISINTADAIPSIAETLDNNVIPDEVESGGGGGLTQITISVPVRAIVAHD
jgi:hypothetical protein